jgi:hypothetical protein
MRKGTLDCLPLMVAAMVLAGAAAPAVEQAPAGPAGHWEGVIRVPDRDLGIAVDLFLGAETKWEAAITIAAQNIKGMPLADVSVKGDAVHFAMKGVPGDPTFAGTVSKDGKSITGDFSQGGMTMPFTLAWKGEAIRPSKAASTAIDASVEGKWEGALETGGGTLRLALALSNKDGKGAATIVSLDQGGAEIQATAVVQTGLRLRLDVAVISAAFEGELKDGQLVGTWTQGPASLPLTFKRVQP